MLTDLFTSLLLIHAPDYGVKPRVAIAIVKQESSFRNVNTYNRQGLLRDIGPAQINLDTALDYGLDIERLQEDVVYYVHSFLMILQDRKSTCRRLPHLPVTNELPDWSCYHSYTEEHRMKYVEMVGRYL